MPKITKISNTRKGHSEKTGKDWEILICDLDEGSTDVQIFGPGKVGDEVTAPTFNDQYNCSQAKMVRADRNAEVTSAIKQLEDKIDKVLEILAYKPHTPGWNEQRAKIQAKKESNPYDDEPLPEYQG
jgi:hypothetical protein